MNQEQAEIVAIKSIEWMAGNREILEQFLATSGATLSTLRDRVDDPDFLASALDFLLMQDRLVLAFCKAANLEISMPMSARQILPGGNNPNWT